MNNSEYIRISLELHLFFDRIMKEHSFFLETSFAEKNANLKPIAQNFKKVFSDALRQSIYLANGNVSNNLIASNELITKDTLEAEKKTSDLSGAYIDFDITKEELTLTSGNIIATEELVNNISDLNRKTLPMIEQLIKFKNEILTSVLSCKMYTTNYPLLISHIMNEAKMYYVLLNKVENRSVSIKEELYEQELFWNDIMKEHAEFMRGLLDPSEEELIATADKYAKDYKMIIQNYNNNPNYFNKVSLNETINFKNFKIAGEEGILNCKVKSIIVPLLADHVLREANHFIRILESSKN